MIIAGVDVVVKVACQLYDARRSRLRAASRRKNAGASLVDLGRRLRPGRVPHLSLFGTPQTRDRVQRMLKEGKPLRN